MKKIASIASTPILLLMFKKNIFDTIFSFVPETQKPLQAPKCHPNTEIQTRILRIQFFL